MSLAFCYNDAFAPTSESLMPTLSDPIRLGAIAAPNRILMAPLTRGRATCEHVPTPIMVTYYAQRASAGLIITEATGISREGMGWPYAPGLWTREQVEVWKPVTAAVHAAGGRIAAQLWHMGRVVHPSVGGAQPVSASDTTAPGDARTYDGMQPHVAARALRLDEIPRLLNDYRLATRNAMEAGFDGVQVHAANGYLIDQFLRDSSNFRADAYGGSVDKRIRLLLEVATAVAGEIGADRTAVRLSPNGMSQGVEDSAPNVLFPAAASALSALGLAFRELREPREPSPQERDRTTTDLIRQAFKEPLVLNASYNLATGTAALASGRADAIAFGRTFLANPDLPQRFARHLPLAKDDIHTHYTQGAEGYTDYPVARESDL